ncbi:MAG: TldD/PmbA family protein [Planctomycetes bacterium]|jgi:predicted Zn-dependent protease|nr:TldD/PmbA family protein [Planctomycetota bacterium]
MHEQIEERFREVVPAIDFCSLRVVREDSETIQVRQGILQPVTSLADTGAMVTVLDKGGMGYAATSDLSKAGLRKAISAARGWARATRKKSVVDFRKVATPAPKGEWKSPVVTPWESVPLAEKIDLLKAQNAKLKTDPRIVDWSGMLWHTRKEQLYLTADGGRVLQEFRYLIPGLSVTANEGAETVSRNFGGFDLGRQGGMEVLGEIRFTEQADTIAREVLELLSAPNCPTGSMDLLLDADQMYLQIHESIGHPLELDRILGDERNYAGTSFVTLDMLGTYRYGSDLLNIAFDPTIQDEFATYGWDDDGERAEKTYIIRNGILERALGGVTSQARAGKPGVANSRACSWNRQPIDRMANLNLEPGASTFDEMVRAIEHGVCMKRNCSWSIDDSRNKFQFGCEYGRVIRDGTLAEVVKKPNYKGISATFWRNLKMVGDRSTFQVLGTPFCGKGEPNQGVKVGHATPACVFGNVDVFGGV